ncbi:hypothetical protein DACRYDRAFT_24725 [Dacryopinax primogenitus]|uniref:Uncharacterized protein n=1 Tax=Dacryopinax primogenitus (strain DJM 731) TaxID=1858805 RepID=M5G3D4_DACPD|nr:uncharacterized protein DACRYDRAFT_24725 [Dacryopinax primogenitus]EJT98272.1 hypothetical protein DACRYDRAFT_24725 [Dacryopinax primogenitus]
MISSQQQPLPTPPDTPPQFPSTVLDCPALPSPPSEPVPVPTTAPTKRTPSFHLILPLPRPASMPLLSPSPSASLLASFYPPSSAEAQAHDHIYEHILHDPLIGATEMGQSAAYAAVRRYILAEDLFIFPTDGRQLSDVLGRFARDVIHSLISQAKTRIEEGGYARARAIAMHSLHTQVLTPSGTSTLLEIHKELTPALSRSEGSVSGDSEGEEVRTPGLASSMGRRARMRMTMTRMQEKDGTAPGKAGGGEVVIASA